MADKYAKKRHYDKLVRDRIPEKLRLMGADFKARTANEAEYRIKLWKKLLEEAAEAEENASAEELADLLEVIFAIADFLEIDRAELERVRLKKLEQRGGFKDRVILEES